MPEPLLEVANVVAAGSWRGQTAELSGTLRLDDKRIAMVTGESGESGESVLAEYASLTGASWGEGMLTLFNGDESLSLRGSRELNRAWGLLLQRGCEMPEMTRGLRGLGKSGAANAELQHRFFEPLLLARRALQEAQAPEFRIRKFDPVEVLGKLQKAANELAAQVYSESPPDRRALEAEFEDYMEPLVAALGALRHESALVESSAPSRRFVAWREWTHQLRRVFLEADRAWSQIAASLNRSGANTR